MEFTALNILLCAFVIVIPTCVYFSFKNGFITGFNSLLAILHSKGYITAQGRKEIGQEFLDELVGTSSTNND